MPSRTTPSTAVPDVAFELGKLTGQVRELIHDQRSEAQKSEADRRVLAKLEGLPERFDRFEARITERLSTLEADKSRRDGERSVVGTILKSPTLQWLAMIATAVWVYVKGHSQ
jgi:hypothetical protein